MTAMRLLNYTLCFKLLSEPRGPESRRIKRPHQLEFPEEEKNKGWRDIPNPYEVLTHINYLGQDSSGTVGRFVGIIVGYNA